MTLMGAAALGSLLSFAIFALMAVWYVAPWLATQQRAEALIPLLWVHAFRHIALQIFSAQKFGFAVSDGARDQIAAGDVIGMILAVIAIVALRYRARIAPVLIWVFVAETLFDLVSSTVAGVREQLFATGVRGHLADPDILCPVAVGEPWPHRLAALRTMPGAPRVGSRVSRSPSLLNR